MHQVRFQLGLQPRHHWGSSQRCPRPPSWILKVLFVKGEKKRKEKRKKEGRKVGKTGEEK